MAIDVRLPDEMEKREAPDDMTAERRRFYTCQPHVIYGFHLRDHVWRKLLVDRVMSVFPEWGYWQEMILGNSEKTLLQRLLNLDETKRPGETWLSVPSHSKDSAWIAITARGPAANEAIDAISTLADRPLYRVRISTENEAGSAERILRQTAALAKRWGCIVVIEDVLGAYYSRSQPRRRPNATVAPLLWFLDRFEGVSIFALPDQDLEIDPRVEKRMCANFSFEYKDATPAHRKVLWECEISALCYGAVGLDHVTQARLDMLAQYGLPWDSIRSIVRAVSGQNCRRRPPDWGSLLQLADKRAKDLASSPSATELRTS